MKAKFFSFLTVILLSISASYAEKVQIGDLYYNLNENELTAEVAKDNSYSNLPTANIPASVTYNDIEYSVTSIGEYAFSDSYSLTAITIPSSVTSIGQSAFSSCESLTSVTIPSGVTSIEDHTFDYCSSLTSIDIPSNVTHIGEAAFHGCNRVTSLTIPSAVTSIGIAAFAACSSLTSIYVDEGNTVYDSRNNCNAIIETNAGKLIAGCQNTIIPSGVRSIENSVFSFCIGLTSIDIPSSVTSIGSQAFFGCTALTYIDIPNSMTSVGDNAFYDCTSLVSITCRATNTPELGSDVFPNENKSIPLYVPAQSISLYQSANGWNEFTNIQAIPSSGGTTPTFPGDPGTLTLNLELKAAVMDGEELQGYTPTGGGGYAKGSSVTITAQDIPGYEFVRWSDSVSDKTRTIELNESMTLTALYSHSMIEIPVAANKWTFICLPPLGDRQYTADMFTYDGLSDVQWGTYNGSKRAAGQSGWETPETFNALQGYIIFSTTAGTLRINAYQNDIRQGESGNTIHAGMIDYASSHAQNANWNFVGNPYAQGYNIAGFADVGITSPITVWNGVGYTTFTPGIDSYVLNPFEAFFIQKAENGAETLPFSEEYLEGNSGSHIAIEGELSGAFSIADGVQIHFSRGNLQYQASTDTWRFAENQYDTIGALNANISDSYSGWIDLFGWGTGDNPTLTSQDYNDYSTFVDWGINPISNGCNVANQWRTLTNEEWLYLFSTRTNAAILFGLGSVNGVNGVIILPDNWNTPQGISFTPSSTIGLAASEDGSSYCGDDGGHYSDNTYTAEQWSVMEQSGAVFLPTAGYRSVTKVTHVNSVSSYWATTPFDAVASRGLYMSEVCLTPMDEDYRSDGHPVRLVR